MADRPRARRGRSREFADSYDKAVRAIEGKEAALRVA